MKAQRWTRHKSSSQVSVSRRCAQGVASKINVRKRKSYPQIKYLFCASASRQKHRASIVELQRLYFRAYMHCIASASFFLCACDWASRPARHQTQLLATSSCILYTAPIDANTYRNKLSLDCIARTQFFGIQ